MRHFIFLIVAVFGISFLSSAQIVEYKLGSNNKAPEYFTQYTQHLGEFDNFYYNVYMNGYGKVFLEKIDAEFNLVSNTLISKDLASAGGTKSKLFYVVLVNGKVNMFYEKAEKGEQKIICNTYSLTGEELGSKLINSMPYSRMGERDFSAFKAKVSKSGKEIAIGAALGYRTKKSLHVQLMGVNLEDLTIIDSKVMVQEMDYKFITSINDIEISENGKVALSVLIKNEKTLNKTDYFYLLSNFRLEFKKLETEEGYYYYTDLEFIDNRIDLAGCFELKSSDKKKKKKGFFYGSINAFDLRFTSNEQLAFDNEYSQFLYSIDINFPVTRLINEGCYRTEIIPIDENRSYLLFEHHCSFISKSRELIVLLVNKKQIEQKWLIPKYFVYNQGDGYSYDLKGEKLRIIYNDNSNNLGSKNLEDSERIFSSFDETASVIVCEVEPNEPIKRQLLLKADVVEGQLIPLLSGNNKEGLFITLNKGNNRVYGVLK
jgi:hypothetical protein